MNHKAVAVLGISTFALASCGAHPDISVPDKLEGDILVAKGIQVNRPGKDGGSFTLAFNLPISKERLRDWQREGATGNYEAALRVSKLWDDKELKQVTFTRYRVDTTTGEEMSGRRRDFYCLSPKVIDRDKSRMDIYKTFGRSISDPDDPNDFFPPLSDEDKSLNKKVCASVFK